MSLALNYPTTKPSLTLDFANTAQVDPRITFSRASSATYYDSNGMLRRASANQPRIDYNPVTLAAQGLLIEEQRTNLLTYSEQFTNPVWNSVTSVTITADSLTAPNGTLTADTLTHTGASLFGISPVTITAGSTLTASIFVKKGNTSFFRVRLATGAVSVSQWVNLDTGTTASNTAGSGNMLYSTASVVAAGSGFYRVSMTVTTSVTTSIDVTYACATVDAGAAANGNYAYIWGAQLEAGAYPTSYIPTTTTALTRSADVSSSATTTRAADVYSQGALTRSADVSSSAQATRAAEDGNMMGTNFSSWYNATEGTFYFEGSIPSNYSTGFPVLYSVNDTTSNNNIQPAINASGDVINVEIKASGSVVSGFYPAYTSGFTKLSFAYKFNDVNYAKDGTAGTTDTSATIPVVSQMNIGGNQAGGNVLNGHVRRITYYPRRLSNTELQSLTS